MYSNFYRLGVETKGVIKKILDIYPLPPSKSLALSLNAWSRSFLSSSSRRFSSFSFRISSSNLLFLFTSLIWKKLKGPSSHDQIGMKVIPLPYHFYFECIKGVQSSLLLHTKISLIFSIFTILPSYLLAHFYLMKKSAKVLRKPSSEPDWETSNRPPNIKCIVPAFFRRLVWRKAVLPRIRR